MEVRGGFPRASVATIPYQPPTSGQTPPAAITPIKDYGPDSFQRGAASPRAIANALLEKELTLGGEDRGRFWHDFASAGHQLKSGNPKATEQHPHGYDPQAQQLATQVQRLNADQRVDLIKQLTGDQSAYSRYAEKVLIYNQQPSQMDTYNLFKPDVQDWGGAGLQSAFTSMALGLITLPIIIPTMIISAPASVGMFATQLGLWLI